MAMLIFGVEVYEGGGFNFRLKYTTVFFEKQTLLRKLCHFRNLVNAVHKNPDEPLARILIMDDWEREQTVVQWNKTAVDYPGDPHIHSAFERQAARTPASTPLFFQH